MRSKIEKLAQFIEESKTVVMTGAGMDTESNIPILGPRVDFGTK